MQASSSITTLALPSSDNYIAEMAKMAKHIDSAEYDYSRALENYLLIRSSSLVICSNLINSEIALQLMFAMMEGKQIIIVDKPIFTNVGIFEKDFILNRLNKVFIYSLAMLEPSDREGLLKDILSTRELQNYVITKHEKVIARARIRKYFRDLL